MLAIDSTHDQAFLADLHAARLQALGVLRSVLNLATLSPEARADFVKTGHAALALLRESRLAATQILQIPLPKTRNLSVRPRDSHSPHTSTAEKFPQPRVMGSADTQETQIQRPLLEANVRAASSSITQISVTTHALPRTSGLQHDPQSPRQPVSNVPNLALRNRPIPASHLRVRSGAVP